MAETPATDFDGQRCFEVEVQLVDTDGNPVTRCRIYVHQARSNRDTWELIVSEGRTEFVLMNLDSANLKRIGDLMGEVTRAAVKSGLVK